VLFLVLLMFVPDTPRWFVLRGQNERALQALRRITDEADARTIVAEIESTLKTPTLPLFSFGTAVIVVGILLSVFQQFVGINAVLYYAPLMFSNLGASTDSAMLQTIVVGAANTIFTVIAILTVDRWGRRPLLIVGALIMGVAMIVLGFLFYSKASGMAPLIAILAYIAGFALSWGPVVWVLLAEMFPNAIKGKAMAIAVAAQWIANLFVSWTFKILIGSSVLNALFNHGFPYWIYGAMSLLAAFLVARYVPETKGKTLEAIQDLWRPGNARLPASEGPLDDVAMAAKAKWPG
jgi:MFS transporter, SP family, xylose:H+ symportor